MNLPKVSVLIPTYNQAQFLGEAIQSVLDQTCPNFELIVVNDASSDNTTEIVKQFNDLRIKYIEHERNQGSSASRNTGIRASSGEFIAFLDSDDYFHPDKLQVHVDFLGKHPEIGATYNARFNLNHSSKTIRDLWRPPDNVTLSDLVLGFPFAPSDQVIRRDWLFQVGLCNEDLTYFGDDLDLNCRLALSGCQFVSVDQALNYRRYHSGRKIKNIDVELKTILRILAETFSDPRCPNEVLTLRDKALSTHYLFWLMIAFDQSETLLGQEYLKEAIRLNPSMVEGKPCKLIESIITYSILDEGRDHGDVLRRIFDQLPLEMAWLKEQYETALIRGYLLKGTRAIQWGRKLDGNNYFSIAAALGAKIDEPYLRILSSILLDYDALFGSDVVLDFFQSLEPCIEDIGGHSNLRWMRGHYSVNKAFQSYFSGQYQKVPTNLLTAIINYPNCLKNRGVLSILFQSIVNMIFQHEAQDNKLLP